MSPALTDTDIAELTAWRRALHRAPELSGEEAATAAEVAQVLTRAGAGANAAGQRHIRVPAGHPEGYLEGFATLYAEAAEIVRHRARGTQPPPEVLVPGLTEGLAGMRFIAACIASSQNGSAWTAV